VKTATLEDEPYRMEDTDEFASARGANRRAFVVETVFDLVGLAARLAAILVNWHRIRGRGLERCRGLRRRRPDRRSERTLFNIEEALANRRIFDLLFEQAFEPCERVVQIAAHATAAR